MRACHLFAGLSLAAVCLGKWASAREEARHGWQKRLRCARTHTELPSGATRKNRLRCARTHTERRGVSPPVFPTEAGKMGCIAPATFSTRPLGPARRNY